MKQKTTTTTTTLVNGVILISLMDYTRVLKMQSNN